MFEQFALIKVLLHRFRYYKVRGKNLGALQQPDLLTHVIKKLCWVKEIDTGLPGFQAIVEHLGISLPYL